MAKKYILNVWDETQQKYVGIPAIKGDTPQMPEVPELILSTTLPERVTSVSLTVDNDGNAFELKYAELEIVFPAYVSNSNSDYYWDRVTITLGDTSFRIDQDAFSAATSSLSLKAPADIVTAFITGDTRSGVALCVANRGVTPSGWETCSNKSNANTSRITANISSVALDSLASAYSKYVPKDTKITLRGIRA